MAQRRILVVDDEENIGRSLRLILEREGYAVSLCSSINEAKAYPQRADVYLLDVRLPDGSGVDLLRWLKSNDNDAPVIMISGHGTIADAVEATRAGPFVKVNCAAIPTELIESELFGHEKGAFTGATSARRGKFELADRGTLFLDEVGDLHAASQAKLLRVLQEGEFHRVGGEQAIRVSVRVIAATNHDLSEMVSQQKFREDLYYRLCVVPVRVPSLRERREDIGALAEYFLGEFCARNNFKPKRLAESALEAFEDYGWPGNIRELRNTVERMAILTR